MKEFTVHFQKGTRVGARRTRMVPVIANDDQEAVRLARREFPDAREQGFRIVRVDHFDDDGHLVVDR